MPKILIAIPAYNEEVAIGSVILRCRQYADEVLVVDDGSEDRTAGVAKLAGANVVRHAVNAGKGIAIQSALKHARSNGFDALVLLDGDAQHDPADIPGLLAPILRDEADLVVGVRRLGTSKMPVHRRVGQRILDFLTAFGSMGAMTDSQSGFRALSRSAIESLVLEERDFSVESEMLIEAQEKHLRIAETPIRVRYDVEGSTKGPISHGFGVVDRLLRIIAVRHPLLFFAIPGFVLSIFGLWYGLQTVDEFNLRGLLPPGKFLLAIVLFFLGTLGLFAGVILNVMPKAVVRILNGHNNIEQRKRGT